MNKGKVLVISGPSAGVGKDTILNILLARHPDWQRITTVVTRPPRAGEVNGVDYTFIDDHQFKQWEKEGKFLETDFHADHWYGTPLNSVEEAISQAKNIILRIDVNGSLEVKKAIPSAVLVYVGAENPAELESRIRARSETSGESEAEIKSRLELAKREAKLKPYFDHIVINPENHPEKAVEEIEKILNI